MGSNPVVIHDAVFCLSKSDYHLQRFSTVDLGNLSNPVEDCGGQLDILNGKQTQG